MSEALAEASQRIAVLGAAGYIGRRIVECLAGDPRFSVRAVTRNDIPDLVPDRRIADARDAYALAAAFEGCDVVVHTVAGDPRTIRNSIAPVVSAAARARCRRIVYLSTAVVHGQAPVAAVDENAPLPRDQRLAYNVAKRDAERRLFALGKSAGLEIVALRPGIVYGPGSRWIADLAESLLAGRAGLVDGGAGLCNAIHVDNVVHAVKLAATEPAAAGHAFLIGEGTGITWRQFYSRVAEPLGVAMESVPSINYDVRAERRRWLRARLRGVARRSGLQGLIQDLEPKGPVADREMALLHRARHVPVWTKAREVLGYAPVVEPEDGWRQTIEWLTHAGYRIAGR